MKESYPENNRDSSDDIADCQDSLRSMLNQSESFSQYKDLLGKASADQAFWLPLLPYYVKSQSVALVIDDTDGNISCKLAPHFFTVISIHSDVNALMKVKNEALKKSLDNVIPIQADLSKPLPIAAESVSLVILLHVSNSRSFQNEMSVCERYRIFIANSKVLLSLNGSLVIIDNNAQNYRDWLHNLRGVSRDKKFNGVPVKRLRRILSGQKYSNIDKYIGDFYYTASFIPLPVFVKNGGLGDLSVYSMSAFYKIKQYVKHRFLPSNLWPSFMLIASRVYHKRVIDEVIESERVGVKLNWGVGRVVVKKIVAGNSGVTILIVGPEDKNDRDVVVRHPRTSEGLMAVQRNTDALKSLSNEIFSDFVPKLYAAKVDESTGYIIEEKLSGKELDGFGEKAELMIMSSCELFIDMQMKGVSNKTFNEALINRFIIGAISPLSTLCDDVKSLLAAVGEFLGGAFKNKNIPIVRSHGDYKLGNILFLDNGQLGGIIDWDMSEKNGLPLLDIYTLILYRISSETGESLADVYKNILLPGKTDVFYKDLIEMACAKYALSSELVFPLMCLFWLTHLRDRVSSGLKSHPDFARENIKEVLIRMIEAIDMQENNNSNNKPC